MGTMKDYWKHREKRLAKHKEYRDQRNKEKPWLRKYYSIKQRCQDSGSSSYSRYGAKGIKMKITKDELEFLWVRDCADKMKVPSIDRIDNQGDYELSNCRFIEMTENNRRKRKKNSVFTCAICGIVFEDYPSRIRVVCSRQCKGIMTSEKMRGNTYAKN